MHGALVFPVLNPQLVPICTPRSVDLTLGNSLYTVYTEQNYKRNTFVFAPISAHEKWGQKQKCCVYNFVQCIYIFSECIYIHIYTHSLATLLGTPC